MGKKGMSEKGYFLIFALVLVLGSWLTMQSFVNSSVKGTLFERLYLSRDIAMMINSMHVGNGIGFYNYSAKFIPMERFNYNFNLHKAIVIDKDTDSSNYYSFSEDKNLGFLNKYIKPGPRENIAFVKTSTFDIGTPLYDTIKCKRAFKSIDLSDVNLLFDAGNEHEITIQSMNDFRKENTKFSDSKISITRQMWSGGETLGEEEINKRINHADMIFSFHLANYGAEKSYIKIYVNPKSKNFDESYNLGCFIANNIQRDANLTESSVAIIPINPDEYAHGKFIDNDKIAFVIELGNINVPEVIEKLKNTNLGKSIAEGVDDYYTEPVAAK